VLLHIVFYAAAHLSSLFAACQRLRDAPSDQAVRNALKALCPEPVPLEHQLNRAFQSQVPKTFPRRRGRVAIDLVLLPYHGQPKTASEEIYRSQAKSGTTHFHAYASAYLVHRGRRFTLALIRVTQGMPMKEVVRRVLQGVRAAGIRPHLLLLDRGFFSVEVIRYLQAARYPFLMPVVRRGRSVEDPRGPSATNVFAAQKRSGWGTYTLTNAAHRTATVGICVHCRNWQGRRKRRGRQTLVYAYWGFTPTTTAWVYETYRTRFGIETSYRQLHEAHIKTTTRDPALRLLFVGLALLLRNIWVGIHYHLLATPRRGGRQLHLDRLRFQTLLLWLAHLAEQVFGFHDEIILTEYPPRPQEEANHS
jgi:putative transposase